MRRAKIWIIALLFLGALVIAKPAPVMAKPCCEIWAPPVALVESGVISAQTAKQVAQWVAKAKSWLTEFAMLSKLITLKGILNDVIGDDLNTIANIFSAGQQAEARMRPRLTQELVDGVAQTDAAETRLNLLPRKRRRRSRTSNCATSL